MLHERISVGYIEVSIMFPHIWQPRATITIDNKHFATIGPNHGSVTWLQDKDADLLVETNCEPYKLEVLQWQ